MLPILIPILLLRNLIHSRSEEHTSELQSHVNLVCRLLLEKKKKKKKKKIINQQHKKTHIKLQHNKLITDRINMTKIDLLSSLYVSMLYSSYDYLWICTLVS